MAAVSSIALVDTHKSSGAGLRKVDVEGLEVKVIEGPSFG
jgi:hypothetical protein